MEHFAILNYVEVKVVVISINQLKDVLYITTVFMYQLSTFPYYNCCISFITNLLRD